jgi:hypothetical protein
MQWDSAEHGAGGREILSPMQIAHHPLFTAREKIELLQQLKAEVTHELAAEQPLGVSPGEIDEAIQAVKLDVQDGVGSEAAATGDA